ncbi:MAG: recombination protein RecR [Bacteroides sp. 43_108]|nr:MAG: recombination protein RecR [Bacteroides sp. 43_108]
MEQQYSSELFEKAVDEFTKLPGIGRKTATRLVLHMLRLDTGAVDNFGQSITNLRHNVKYCKICHNISDTDVCSICANTSRDKSTICVVENIQDVMAIESTTLYHGLYHVLGGVISPMDGIGPNDLEIESLIDRIAENDVNEVIFALSSTMEGDTTNFFISRKLAAFKDLKVSILARGMSINDELQYTDEVTLGRSIINRVPFSTKY